MDKCVVCGATSEAMDFNTGPNGESICDGECMNIYLHSEQYAEAIWPDVPVLD
jgi:hypothetical protein